MEIHKSILSVKFHENESDFFKWMLPKGEI